MHSSCLHLMDVLGNQKSFWSLKKHLPECRLRYIPLTSTDLSRWASLCRSVAEFPLRWSSFVWMKSSSYTGRSILYVSWVSAPDRPAASSSSITEAFRCLSPTASEWWSRSFFFSCRLHNFNGCQTSVESQGKERENYSPPCKYLVSLSNIAACATHDLLFGQCVF